MSEFDEVILAAREGLEPSAADRDRVWKGLSARAGLAGAAVLLSTKAAAGTTAGTASTLAGQSAGALTKLFFTSMVVTFAGGGAVIGVTRYRTSHERAPSAVASASSAHGSSRSPRSAHREAPSVSPAPARPAVTEPPAASQSAERSAATAPSDTAPRDGTEIARELSLLKAVRQVASSGQHARAQELLDRLDEEFPRGALLEERAALRVITACEAGATGQAERASGFLRRYPASVYAAKVQHVCRAEPAPAETSSGSVRSFTDPAGPGH